MNLGPNVAPSLGPVLGGVLAHSAGWPYIFWFLCALAGVGLFLVSSYLPETARSVVGNGRPSALKLGVLPLWLSSWGKDPAEPVQKAEERPFVIPNPLACLKILLYRDSAMVITVSGVFYMVYCGVQAILSALFISLYGLNDLEAGLIYLPFGFGCLVGSVASGKLKKPVMLRKSFPLI